MDQAQRIKIAIEKAEITPADVAARCGISVQAVYKWLKDPARNIRPAHLFGLADVTRHNARWIATGEGPADVSSYRGQEQVVTERPPTPYLANPQTVSNQLISGIHAMLRVAGLPVTCIGHNPELREAFMSGKPSIRYTDTHIRAAVLELVDELKGRIQHLSGEQVAELLSEKLRTWVEPQPDDNPPKNKTEKN